MISFKKNRRDFLKSLFLSMGSVLSFSTIMSVVIEILFGKKALAQFHQSAFWKNRLTSSRMVLIPEVRWAFPRVDPAVAYYSDDDGNTWSQVILPVAMKWYDVVWTGSSFIAVHAGKEGANPTVNAVKSIEGITWTNFTMPAMHWWGAIHFAQGKLYIVAMFEYVPNVYSLADSIYSSIDDGVSWNLVNLPRAMRWGDIASNGSNVLVVPHGTDGSLAPTVFYALSTNGGTSYVEHQFPVAGNWRSSLWTGQRYVVLDNGMNSNGTRALSSATGVTGSWTIATLPIGNWRSMAFNGSVIVGFARGINSENQVINYCIRSTDHGLTWTSHTLPMGNTWGDVTWNGKVFCAAGFRDFIVVPGGSNHVVTSPDGITWTAKVINTPAQPLSFKAIASKI